ncbi:MAG: NUDIX hydrolase [Candidatus Magasanikbacteria bacterium GW2011_GWC2_37_14]|uniref:NUDIX hydrolase n=1 Tax=Candidatus Magasanikbacteria bacterium GW2011_GWC2_37_14 TaxID=1619046 RepID=A0A0G0GLX5_9BACT|nr:MAG: NUDIX hydrolase [Candidatus Magasanikbacteria bacterium GW2011_GWC2_37_14]
MKNKAFIFDWSGTLCDNFHLFCKVVDNIFPELGRETITQDEIKRNFTLPYMKFWNKYFPELSKEKQNILYEKHLQEAGTAEIYPQVTEIINYLNQNNYQLFILSSDPLSTLLPDVKKSGFAKLISKTIGEVHEKQDTLISLTEEYNLDKNLSYYVGDTFGDVEAGKIAGFKTIGISWGYQHKNELAKSKPDYLIDDIVEIKDVV